MTDRIAGIHHVTAIATDPQRNLDFYAGVLGMRLVKKTVNFDDPATYHFYFGDETGRPGTILTFFPWTMARRGSRGAGQATTVAFSVPAGSLDFWRERLESHRVALEDPARRFGEEVLTFLDPDGLKVEMVADPEQSHEEPWGEGPVPARHAIRSFHSVTLTEKDPEPTVRLLTETMGYRPADEAGARFRFESGAGGRASRVDVIHAPDVPQGQVEAGTIHHVAFRVADDQAQRIWRQRIAGLGLDVTRVLDRQYFHSVYFREPGGVLFELATDPPGFTLDESVEELGSGLKLPAWLEDHRQGIEQNLPGVKVPEGAPPEGGESPSRRPQAFGEDVRVGSFP